MTDMNLYTIIVITVVGGIGLTVLFFGALFTIAGAFGHKHNMWGIFCIVLLPLSLLYCLLHWQETKYQRKYMLSGLVLVGIALIAFAFL